MKKFIVSLILGLLILPAASLAQGSSEFSAEQLALRTDLFNFFKEEGFMPEYDTDGDIKFKSEGSTYYLSVSKTDENPMYVTLARYFSYPEEYSKDVVVMATKQLNLYKGVKVLCFDKSIKIGAELFVRSSEPVKGAFYKLRTIINSVCSDVESECAKIGSISSSSASISEIPFLVTKFEVANVEKNGDIIQDYGSSIWDFKTKYLKPRITVRPLKSAGKYTVYVKLYKDGVLDEGSTAGYSYSDTVTLSGSSSQVITLSGWGRDSAGNWSIGEYRFEVWYNDYCIGSKTFKVI